MYSNPLYVAFFWHMHQPYYKDLMTGEYYMPWVRLHSAKNYYHMVALLDRYPSIRQTFNLVPSLLAQIQDYGDNEAQDVFLRVSKIPAAELTEDDQMFLLMNFFMANWDSMVRVSPRYETLLEKRGTRITPQLLKNAMSSFSTQDYLDLQVWYNLCWIHPAIIRDDPQLLALVRKDKSFTEEEKALVLEKQHAVLKKVIPKYKEVWERGQIEVTTSPHYHPIMPLVCDARSAREAMPWVNLPQMPFTHPEDVDAQVSRGVALFQSLFGRSPKGMWPSEGSVSDAIIPILAKNGIEWAASDEEVLAAALGLPTERTKRGFSGGASALYRPYWVNVGNTRVAMVFRDKHLSDRIGFVYSRWPASVAADDLVAKLREIRKETIGMTRPALVSIIMDGENAWEYYSGSGEEFLNRLYTLLSQQEDIVTTSVGEYLRQFPPDEGFSHLVAGSWIGHNFDVWIGGREENKAWDCLAQARETLVHAQRNKAGKLYDDDLKTAWEEIYIAEGSDWNWWYGEHHSSSNDEAFDQLYRKHLFNVYMLIGEDPPTDILEPIIVGEQKPTVEPAGLMTPIIDGRDSHYYEWLAAGYVEVKTAGGTMHQAESVLSRIYFGFDIENLYIRVDNSDDLKNEIENGAEIVITFLPPKKKEIHATLGRASNTLQCRVLDPSVSETAENRGSQVKGALNKVLELAIPFTELEAVPEQTLKFLISIEKNGLHLGRWPAKGPILVTVPTPDFDRIHWCV